MRILTITTLLGLLALAPAAAEDDVARYTDPVYGFSLDVPAIGPASEAPVLQRLMVFGAARDGFAPSCNVQIQHLDMTMKAYMDLSLGQLEAAGWPLHERSATRVSGRAAETMDYSSVINGQDLRNLALIVEGEGKFWLLTCAGLSATFDQVRADFTTVIESFRVVGEGERAVAAR